MADQWQDIHLPNATITKLIKYGIPNKINLTKEAKLILNRIASTFVLYVTNEANSNTKHCKRKTVSDFDIKEALKEISFYSFLPILEKSLEEFEQVQQNKRIKKKNDESTVKDDDSELRDHVDNTDDIAMKDDAYGNAMQYNNDTDELNNTANDIVDFNETYMNKTEVLAP